MYNQRRLSLAKQLPENSIALFFSGKAPYKVGDEKYPFSVNRNFYYLTGLDKENMILAIFRKQEKIETILFIERYDEESAKWVGGRISPEDASHISDIDDIYWIDEAMDTLDFQLSRFYDHASAVPVYADFTRQEPYQADSEAHQFTRNLLQQYPYITLHNVAPYMAQLRLIKSEAEIKLLSQAIEITKLGIYHMMNHVTCGMKENQLEAYFDFILKSNGCQHSFPSIIASGKNATILHYDRNQATIKKNSMVLCDLGASCSYINADITRTFPANGKFSKRQRQIYDIVLEANKYIMSLVRPGITLKELNQKLIEFYEQKLSLLGMLKRGKTVQDYYWHGVSHMLGLETHDVSLSNYPLRKGNVFTIEPGLYLEDEGIGIRIEDNVLVTEDGCINLSASIIKEADEIEAYMQKHNIHLSEPE